MKLKQITQIKILISITTLFLLFQNFAFLSWEEAMLVSVNQKTRTAHARELLGDKYRGSLAEIGEWNPKLHRDLFYAVKEQLPARDKHLAVELTKALILEGQKYNLDPVFLAAMISTESKFNTRARGRHGEIGLMQIKPDTAAWIAERSGLQFEGAKTLERPAVNIKLGAAYVQYMRTNFPKSAARYVAAYNMGPQNVRKLGKHYAGFEYTTRVLGNYDQMYRALTSENHNLGPLIVGKAN